MKNLQDNPTILKIAKACLRSKCSIALKINSLKALGLDLMDIIDLAIIVADEDEKELLQ